MFNVSPLTQMKFPIAQISYYLNNQVGLMDLSMIQDVKLVCRVFHGAFPIHNLHQENTQVLLVMDHSVLKPLILSPLPQYRCVIMSFHVISSAIMQPYFVFILPWSYVFIWYMLWPTHLGPSLTSYDLSWALCTSWGIFQLRSLPWIPKIP